LHAGSEDLTTGVLDLKKKMIVIAAVIVTIGLGGGAYALGFLDTILNKESVANTNEASDPVPEVKKEPLFFNLPPLVVSSNYNGSLRYLQVKLAILTRSEETIAKLENSTPLIQNALIMLLDSFEFAELEESEGKETLRAQAEEEVRKLIADDNVESVLFTGFVIQ